ncbi:unnamed protein product [Phyllotreta striolata]|uniref:Inositol polyphosphate 1-phosphatase n=1 Tax=Phyllotreta striolata TaxID=444603 RepID=A0A9N9TV02_PHYSR|nr:unnamed protein product [Phyllotreta striolata]
MDLLRALIVVSEKAANIARACREDEHLFQLLVQKKNSNEANPRFVEDFKTLADVLIQEMVKHDIGHQFKELSSSIRGEENNVFKNKLGDKIRVEVKPTEEDTSNLLEMVLNGDQQAASRLASEVHRNLEIDSIKTDVPQKNFDIDLSKLGVWIDPIDCTAEYVHGSPGRRKQNIHVNGLKCVTVLIGAYNKITGLPVMGVINRPFLDEDDYQLSQRCIWGVALPNFRDSSGLNKSIKRQVVSISSSENEEIKEKLRHNNVELVEASGAGYKILTVILGLADAYVLSKGTTFKWDTCAPHAVLKALGGDILDYKKTVENHGMESITYSEEECACNATGIIAYRDEDFLKEIVDILKS